MEAGLSGLLETFVPRMFPLCHIAIRLYPDQALLIVPGHWKAPFRVLELGAGAYHVAILHRATPAPGWVREAKRSER